MMHRAALALILVPGLAIAQPAAHRPPTIQVTGQAKVSEPPNRAYVGIGVVTHSPKAADAARENAADLTAVLRALRSEAGPTAELKTTDFLVEPQYQYHNTGAPPTLIGYTVTNVVQVRLDDLSRIGPVVDAAMRSGANILQNVRFTLRNEDAAREKALAEAAVSARGAAEALAHALGLRIVRIVSVEEGRPVVVPMVRQQAIGMRLAAERIPTPIETGSINVTANVTLTVAVAPEAR